MSKRIDLDELERKAGAATQGAWTNGTDPSHFGAPEVTDGVTFAYFVPDAANAAHIAAASPPVVLALIARIRELEAAIVEVRNDLRDGCVGQQELDALLDKGVVLS